MKIDRGYLTQTLSDLVRINSVNPTLVPGGAGEVEIAAYVRRSLAGCNLRVNTYEPQPGRVSVVGRWPGTGRGKFLMLNAHYDTVGVDGMDEPFSGAVRDGRLYGRGAFDMKGSLAASMTALKALADGGVTLGGDVMVAAVADEEYGSIGTADLVACHRAGHLRVDGAVITEPTALKICIAHKGYLWIDVETVGRSAHGSKFEQGVDANMRMGRFLAELDKLEQTLRNGPAHPLVGPPSLHAAQLSGGSGLSTYAAACKLQIERRTVPGETEAKAVAEVQAIVNRLQAADPTFHAHVKPFFVRDPFEVSRDAGIVQAADKAVSKVSGKAPEYFGDTPWMDAALLSAAGIETVVIGPAGEGAHADVEWVDVDSCLQLAEILVHVASEYCR